MANKKITDLSTASGVDTSWVIPVCNSSTGISYKLTLANLSTLIGGGDITAPTVSSMTVENSAPSQIVVVFSESVTGVVVGDYSFKKNGVAWSDSSVSGSGTTWTFTMASAAVNGDTLLASYSGSGTVDGSSNSMVSFTDAAVTNNVSAARDYLTWGTLASDHEQWNSNKSIRRKASEIDAWENQTSNVSVSIETFTGGDRLVFSLADINKTCIVGIINSSAATQLISNSQFGLTTDSGGSTGLVQAFEGSAVVGSTRAGSTSELYCIFLNSGQIFYQYSTDDGLNWTTFYTSLGSPSGTYYAQVQIYQANFGPDEIFKV